MIKYIFRPLVVSLSTAFVVTLSLLEPASASFPNNNNNQDEDQRRADLEDIDKRDPKRTKIPPKDKEEMDDDEGNQDYPVNIENEDEAGNYARNRKRPREDAFGEDEEKERVSRAGQYEDPIGELNQILEKFNLNAKNEEDQRYIEIIDSFVDYKQHTKFDSSKAEIASNMLSLAKIAGLDIYNNERHKSFWFYTFKDDLERSGTGCSTYILDNELTAGDIDQFYNDFGLFFPEEIHQLFVDEVSEPDMNFYQTINATKLLEASEKFRLIQLLNTIKGNGDLNDQDNYDDNEIKDLADYFCRFISMHQELSGQDKDLIHEIANKMQLEELEILPSYRILEMFTRKIRHWYQQDEHNNRKKILHITSDLIKKAVDSCKADPRHSMIFDSFVDDLSGCLYDIVELVNDNLDEDQSELINSLLFNCIKYNKYLDYKEDYISSHSLQALKLLIDKLSPDELKRLNPILDHEISLSHDIYIILAKASAVGDNSTPSIYMDLCDETPATLNLIKDVLLKSSYSDAEYIIKTLADIRKRWLNQKWVNLQHANCQSTDREIINLFSTFSPAKLHDTLICINAGLVDLSAVDLNVRIRIFAELNDDVLNKLGSGKFGESIKLDDPKFDYTPLFKFLNRVPRDQLSEAVSRINRLMYKQSSEDRKRIINDITRLKNPDRFIDLFNYTGKLTPTPHNGEKELLHNFLKRLMKLNAAHSPELKEIFERGCRKLPRISDTWDEQSDLDSILGMCLFGPNSLDKLVQLANLLNEEKINKVQYTHACINAGMLPAEFDISYDPLVTCFNSLRQSRNQDGLNRIFDHWKSLFTHQYAPRANNAIQRILRHKTDLGLNDDDEIVQHAIRIQTQQDPNNPKNPYNIHSNLLSKKKEMTQWNQIPAVLCQLDNVRLKLNAEKLAVLHSCFAYDLESIPTITEGEFVASLNSVKEVLKGESEQRTTLMHAVGRQDTARFIAEIEAHLKSESHVRTLLRAPSTHVQGSKLKCVLNSIKSSPTDVIRLERLVQFLSTTRNCADGQNTAINTFYTHLEAEHRLRTKLANSMVDVSCEEQSLIKRLNDCMQLTIENLLGSGSPLLKALCSQDALKQEVHQAIYVKNLIGDRAGLADPILFDTHGGCVDSNLLKMSCQELLNKYYELFNLQDFIHQTLTKFNTVVRECHGKDERDGLYNAIRDICERNTGCADSVEDWFDWDDDFIKFTGLNQIGFVGVMKHIGILEDDQPQ